MRCKILTPTLADLEDLCAVEHAAWSSPGENIDAGRDKIAVRLRSFRAGVSLGLVDGRPAGSQYAFRFRWDGSRESLASWDEYTACGWTDRVHVPDGDTGFLVGVGVVPDFRREKFEHNLRWPGEFRISELLISYTLDNLFAVGVRQVIGCARVPTYHKKPEFSVGEYCTLRREDGKLYDPVLRFHQRMGAEVLRPVEYAMDDPESRNAGCWVIYRHPFEG